MSPGSRGNTNADKSLDQQQKRDFKSSTRLNLCADSSDAQNTLTEGTNIWLPKTCGFIGGGCMADALLGGFLKKDAFSNKNVVVTDICQDRLDFMENKYGVQVTTCNTALLSEIKIIMLAVKPQVMDVVLKEIAPMITDEHLLVSIAAGYTIQQMENHLGTDKRIIRVMPNTPSQIGAGASGFAMGDSATENDANTMELLLNSVGVAAQVTESQLDAVTGVSGCGPAYIFLLIEAMADGGVKMGLSRDIALKLATQTVMGSAKMVQDTGEHPGVLKDKVMSPGGATAAAVHRLEELGFRNCAISAVEASTKRSIELGKK